MGTSDAVDTTNPGYIPFKKLSEDELRDMYEKSKNRTSKKKKKSTRRKGGGKAKPKKEQKDAVVI